MPVTTCSGEGSLGCLAPLPFPSATLPHALPAPLPPHKVGWLRRGQPRSPALGAARPKRPSHPRVGGLQEAGRARSSPPGAAGRPATCRPPPPYLAPRRPQSRLWGPRGGAGLRRPPGLCVSSTSGRCLGVEFLLSLSPGRWVYVEREGECEGERHREGEREIERNRCLKRGEETLEWLESK